MCRPKMVDMGAGTKEGRGYHDAECSDTAADAARCRLDWRDEDERWI
jgi:hypothetical protein